MIVEQLTLPACSITLLLAAPTILMLLLLAGDFVTLHVSTVGDTDKCHGKTAALTCRLNSRVYVDGTLRVDFKDLCLHLGLQFWLLYFSLEQEDTIKPKL